MNYFVKPVFVVLSVGLLLFGCSQDPSSVGSKLTGDKFSAHQTTLVSIGDTSFRAPIANGTGSFVLIGQYGALRSRAFLRFTVPDTLAGVRIDTAELIVTVGYTWNAISTPAEFEIQKVSTPWSSATVTADSLSSLVLTPTNSGRFKDTLSIGRVLTAQVDTTLIRQWITDAADTSRSHFFSIAVLPKSSQPDMGVWGFYEIGLSEGPSLKIIYTRNGKKDSVSVNNGEDTFIATRVPFSPSGYIETQGGISVRSKISFNLSTISDSVNRAIVNNATLELTLDNSKSVLGAGSPDTVVALFGGSNSLPDSVSLGYYAYGYRTDATQTSNSVYTFAVTSMVQQWLNSPSTNHGIVLRSATDVTSVDTHFFYSSKDSTKAPRLTISYTKK